MITNLSRKLGCGFPLFAFSHCRDIIVEVTKAGGFGVLGAAGHSPEELEQDLNWIDRHVGGLSYGVDVLMTSNYDRNVDQKEGSLADHLPRAQADFVEQWLKAEGVPPLDAIVANDYASQAKERERYMTDGGVAGLLEVTWKHPKVKMLVAALGTPPAHVIEEAHRRNILVGALCGDPKHAERHCQQGVDVVIAQGTEAGGHTGSISTMVLLPQVVQICKGRADVLSAGGYAHGSQVLAALAMGAQGVWAGSIWLGTKESPLLPNQRELLFAASSRDTVRTKSITGKPVRALIGKYTEIWSRPDAPPALMPPLQRVLFLQAMDRVERANRPDLFSTPAGQVVGMMNEDTTCKEILYRMQKEFAEATESLEAVTQHLGS
jgi:NAD(P)H-dependent flavin oxidoreductase YrpB (nitropropane dioxygenase family)